DPRRGRLGVRVDDEDAVVRLDERGVAVDLVRARGHADVDALRHLLDVEEGVVAARAAVDHDEPPQTWVSASAETPTGRPPGRRLGQYKRGGGVERPMAETAGAGSLRARLVLPLSVVVGVVVVGTLGYRWLWRDVGGTWLDGLFMTVTTITTIGYGEVKPLDSAGRIFTIAIAMIGIGAVFYPFTVVIGHLVATRLAGPPGGREM